MKKVIYLAGLMLISAGPAIGQQDSGAQMLDGCEIVDSSRLIRIVHCPIPTTDEAALAQVGRAACSDTEICGTWIWKQRDDMPQKAPENHDGLTQDEVTSATAVWSQETEQLITIRTD